MEIYDIIELHKETVEKYIHIHNNILYFKRLDNPKPPTREDSLKLEVYEKDIINYGCVLIDEIFRKYLGVLDHMRDDKVYEEFVDNKFILGIWKLNNKYDEIFKEDVQKLLNEFIETIESYRRICYEKLTTAIYLKGEYIKHIDNSLSVSMETHFNEAKKEYEYFSFLYEEMFYLYNLYLYSIPIDMKNNFTFVEFEYHNFKTNLLQ